MRRLVFALVASVIALLWQAPATLVDIFFSKTSGGTLRLAEAKGSVWSGQAIVVSAAQRAGQLIPQIPAEWVFDVSRLLDQLLAWRISSGGTDIAVIGIGFKGLVVSHLHVRGPVSLLIGSLSHNLARAGWRGDFDLQSRAFRCTWKGHCGGRLDLLWNGAASDLLPNKTLGNYKITADGAPGDELRFQVRTTDGNVRVQGEGGWRADGSMSFRGTVKGEPELLQRLPSIAGPWVTPTGQADTWDVSISLHQPARR